MNNDPNFAYLNCSCPSRPKIKAPRVVDYSHKYDLQPSRARPFKLMKKYTQI